MVSFSLEIRRLQVFKAVFAFGRSVDELSRCMFCVVCCIRAVGLR